VGVTSLPSMRGLRLSGSGGPRPAVYPSVIIQSFEAGRMGPQRELLTASLNKEQKERNLRRGTLKSKS